MPDTTDSPSDSVPAEVAQAYAFANTPSYLYKTLLATDYVSDLASKSDEVLQTLLLSATQDRPRSVASSYAALVAWLVKNGLSSIDSLKVASSLEWANAIVDLHRRKFVPTTATNLRFPKVTTEHQVGFGAVPDLPLRNSQ